MVSLRTGLALAVETKICSHLKTEEGMKLGAVKSIERENKKQQKATSEWSADAVAVLLDIYSEKFALGRGSLRGKDWEEVLAEVNTCTENMGSAKTMKQCKDKVDSLKRRYKSEKLRAVKGNAVSWPFFAQLDNMMASILRQGRSLEPCVSGRPPAAVPEFCGDSAAHAKKEDFARVLVSAEKDAIVNRSRTSTMTDRHRPQVKHLYSADMVGDKPLKRAHGPIRHCVDVESRKRRFSGSSNVVTGGFSDVAAKIEAVKIQIVSQITLEMALLRRTKKKKKTGY